MSDILSFSQAANTAMLVGAGGLRGFIDAGASKGSLEIYGALKPVPGGVSGAPPLVVVTLAKPSGEMVNNELRLLIDNTAGCQVPPPGGSAVWGRIINGGGEWVCDGDVSDADGGGAFKLQGVGTTLYAGGYLALGTLSIA